MEKGILLFKIVLGSALMAMGVNAFILPFSFISGGTTGLALLLHHAWNIPVQTFITWIMMGSFIVGALVLGRKFALSTLISSLAYPLFIQLFSFLSQIQLTRDPFTAAIAGGLIMGTGLGLILQSGASSGGLDIPPLIARKYLHLPLTAGLYGQDLLLLLGQIPFCSAEQIVFGLILSGVTMFWMNHILTMGKSAVEILVISQEYEKIRQALLIQADQGVTLLEMETGYTKTASKAVVSVFSRSQLTRIRSLIYQMDPQAFMVVSSVQEVRGLGFRKWNGPGTMERTAD